MSVKIRALGWDIIEKFVTIYFILNEAYQKRKPLMKGARLAAKAAKWTAIRSVGLTFTFLGGMVLCVLPIGALVFARVGAQLPPGQYAPYSIGLTLALLIYGFLGLLGFGTGLWILAPRRAPGKFGKKLVWNHILRRGKQTEKTVPTISLRFGLIHKMIKASVGWA